MFLNWRFWVEVFILIWMPYPITNNIFSVYYIMYALNWTNE